MKREALLGGRPPKQWSHPTCGQRLVRIVTQMSRTTGFHRPVSRAGGRGHGGGDMTQPTQRSSNRIEARSTRAPGRVYENRHSFLALMWVLAAAPAWLMMRQTSTLLAAAQSEGRSAYRMSALNSPYWGDGRIVDALNAWSAAGVDGGISGLVRSWVQWHIVFDLLVWAPATFLILRWGLARAFADGAPPPLFAVLPPLYLIFDEAENLLTLWLARDLSGGAHVFDSGADTYVLLGLTWMKWLVGVSAVLVVVLCAVLRGGGPRRRLFEVLRLGWVVRVQVVSVAILTMLIALPAGGPLEQFPDILRSANDPGLLSWSVMLPGLALIALSVALWAGGEVVVETLSDRIRDVKRRPSLGDVEDDEDTEEEVGADDVGEDRDVLEKDWILLLAAAAGTGLVAAIAWLAPGSAHPAVLAMCVPFALVASASLINRVIWYADTHTPGRLAERVPWARSQEWTWAEVARVRTLVRVLAVAPPTLIAGMGAIRAYAPQLLLTGDVRTVDLIRSDPFLWVLLGFLIAIVGTPLAYHFVCRIGAPRLRRDGERPRSRLRPGVILPMVAIGLVLLGGAFAIWPKVIGRAFHGHGTVTMWLAVLAAVAGLVQWAAELHDPVHFARRLGFERTPWFAIGFAWVLLTVALAGEGYHAATTTTGEPTTVGVEDALDQWYAEALRCRDLTASSSPEEVAPMVLVAAPGGGARAAYWTAISMAGLSRNDPCAGNSVFAASGVSGGSVGLAVWSVSEVDEVNAAIQRLTGPDTLSANLATMLFRDMPMSLVGLNPRGVDRATVTEDMWVERVPGLAADFHAERAPGDGWDPLLLLNSVDLASGCKVLMTRLDLAADRAPLTDPTSQTLGCAATPRAANGKSVAALAAGTLEAHNFLSPEPECDDPGGADALDKPSLSVATAAHLSARFPFVSPTGRLYRCSDTGQVLEQLYVADGGYLENTGIHTLLGLWADIRPWVEENNQDSQGPSVVPIAVVVDNHYRSPAKAKPGNKLNELNAPQQALGAVRRSLLGTETMEQQLTAGFTGNVPGLIQEDQHVSPDALRWFVIAPTTRPQIAAPLGWSLSDTARASMRCQLDPLLQPADTPQRVAVCPTTTAKSSTVAVLNEWLNGRIPASAISADTP